MDSPHTTSSFAAPVIATPLVQNGVRYQQDANSNSAEKEIGAVYLAAHRVSTGELLWRAKIECATTLENESGRLFPFDFYVHLTNISAGPSAQTIHVTSSTGKRYSVDTQTHQVSLLGVEANHQLEIEDFSNTAGAVNSSANTGKMYKFPIPVISLRRDGMLYQQAAAVDIPLGAPAGAYLQARDGQTGETLWMLPITLHEAGETVEFFNITRGPNDGKGGVNEVRILATEGKQYALNLNEMRVRQVLVDDSTDEWNPFEPPLADLPPQIG